MMHIGQILPAPSNWHMRSIYDPDDARWHALTVRTMCESSVEAWLAQHGVYAFHPVKRRVTRRKGRKIECKQRYLPGYVFAKFPGRAIVHRVLHFPQITGAITLPREAGEPGEWAILSPHDLRGIHAMREQDDASETVRRNAGLIHTGDRVRVLGGLTGDEGQEVDVLEITASGRVRFRLRMFGADVPAEARLDRVQKVG